MGNIIPFKLTPEQFDRLATRNMVATLETLGYFDEPTKQEPITWPLDDDFGGY